MAIVPVIFVAVVTAVGVGCTLDVAESSPELPTYFIKRTAHCKKWIVTQLRDSTHNSLPSCPMFQQINDTFSLSSSKLAHLLLIRHD